MKKIISVLAPLASFVFFVLIMPSATAKDFTSDIIALDTSTIHKNQSSPYTPNFIVFDGTKYLNKPNLEAHGFQPIKIVYESEMWSNKNDYQNLPEKPRIKTIAQNLPTTSDYIILDIEHWPLTGNNEAVIDDSLSKYKQVVAWYKEFQPDLKVGFYGRPPIPDYWRAINANSQKKRADWMLENDRIISLAQTVDVFYPSLYTFYTDKAGWVEYATAQISEARRLANGKPVFAFLWPQYHNSNRLLKCQFLPADYWQLQLETVSKLADGVVIWGGWDVCNSKGKALQWNDNAKWWQVTKAFIKKLKNSSNQG